MRADIHDGREHDTLQLEAGYVDARPHTARSTNAMMECYRRAMIAEQTLEGRRENLNQANKLSRTYATLIEALMVSVALHASAIVSSSTTR